MSSFVAIDFETANRAADSACAIGTVWVSDGWIVHEEHRLIRPRSRDFQFTYIHQLTWRDVAESPGFAEVWDSLSGHLAHADFIAAHNAPFDRRVLEACCDAHSLDRPQLPYVCTVSLARQIWNVRPTRLPDVCAFLKIPLRHHDAGSDARACAEIVMAAESAGWMPNRMSADEPCVIPLRLRHVSSSPRPSERNACN